MLQEYSYQFTGLLATHHIDIIGGDARLRNLELRVVPNPSLKLSVRCEYPAYMERTSTTIDLGTDAVAVPVGSKLTVSGIASKPLESLAIERPPADERAAERKVLSADQLGGDRNTFSYTFEPFPNPTRPANSGSSAVAADKQPLRDYALQFTLRDADGIKSRNSRSRSTLVAVPDEPPEVKVHLVGTREPVITTKGRLPAAGKITDDHGLSRAWWDYAIEERTPINPQTAPGKKPDEVAAKPAPQRKGEVELKSVRKSPPLGEYAVNEQEAFLEAPDLGLKEGQKVSLTIRAADLCNLGTGPNVASGENWQLDVVSEDELLNSGLRPGNCSSANGSRPSRKR